jgi:hypothetical protein
MRETRTHSTIAAQVCAAWAVGAMAPLAVTQALIGAMFARSGVALLAVASVALAIVVLVLYAAVTGTRVVTGMGATAAGRVLWALLVAGGGAIGWSLGWAVTDAAGLGVSRSPALTVLLGGVPFALVAGLLYRSRDAPIRCEPCRRRHPFARGPAYGTVWSSARTVA